MSSAEPAKERIVHRLMEAVDRLHSDIERVELWASALGGLTRAIPDYDPAKSKLNSFMLPQPPSDQAADATDSDEPEGSPRGRNSETNPAPKKPAQ